MHANVAAVTLPRSALFALLAALLIVAAAAPAGHATTEPKICGKITVRDRDYAVRAHLVSCDFARRWSRRYLRNRSKPSGWRCERYSGTSIKFVCRRGGKDYYVIRK